MKMGTIMQACREKAGFSQEKMAEILNRSRSCISKFENGHKVPDLQTMVQWAEVTGTREVIISFIYGMDGLTILQNLITVAGS